MKTSPSNFLLAICLLFAASLHFDWHPFIQGVIFTLAVGGLLAEFFGDDFGGMA